MYRVYTRKFIQLIASLTCSSFQSIHKTNFVVTRETQSKVIKPNTNFLKKVRYSGAVLWIKLPESLKKTYTNLLKTPNKTR